MCDVAGGALIAVLGVVEDATGMTVRALEVFERRRKGRSEVSATTWTCSYPIGVSSGVGYAVLNMPANIMLFGHA